MANSSLDGSAVLTVAEPGRAPAIAERLRQLRTEISVSPVRTPPDMSTVPSLSTSATSPSTSRFGR